MNRGPRTVSLFALAATAALGLAACGVKGPLEAPASSVAATPAAETRASGSPAAPSSQTSISAIAAGTTSASVTEAPAAKQRSVLDWLID